MVQWSILLLDSLSMAWSCFWWLDLHFTVKWCQKALQLYNASTLTLRPVPFQTFRKFQTFTLDALPWRCIVGRGFLDGHGSLHDHLPGELHSDHAGHQSHWCGLVYRCAPGGISHSKLDCEMLPRCHRHRRSALFELNFWILVRTNSISILQRLCNSRNIPRIPSFCEVFTFCF